MQLADIKKGMVVRVIDRDDQYYLQQGNVLSVMHELLPKGTVGSGLALCLFMILV